MLEIEFQFQANPCSQFIKQEYRPNLFFFSKSHFFTNPSPISHDQFFLHLFQILCPLDIFPPNPFYLVTVSRKPISHFKSEPLDTQHALGTKQVSHFPSETSLAALSNGLWPQYSCVISFSSKK
jgi:hypothetical protein